MTETMSEYEPRCVFCNNGREIRLTGHVLCRFKGVVSPSCYCNMFEMNYAKLKPKRLPVRKKTQFSPEDFSLD